MKETYNCEVCGVPVLGWEPEYCCVTPNRDCDCQGRPIYPCLCSEECERKYIGNMRLEDEVYDLSDEFNVVTKPKKLELSSTYGRSNKPSKSEIHRQICLGLNDLYTQKNKEYGDSFGKAFHDMGMISPIVDMYHKLQRIISIHDKQDGDVKFESVEDSLRDLANYSIMTLVELENKK